MRNHLLILSARALVMFSLSIASLAIVGYLCNYNPLINWGFPAHMALPTAISFACNCIALQIILGLVAKK